MEKLNTCYLFEPAMRLSPAAAAAVQVCVYTAAAAAAAARNCISAAVAAVAARAG